MVLLNEPGADQVFGQGEEAAAETEVTDVAKLSYNILLILKITLCRAAVLTALLAKPYHKYTLYRTNTNVKNYLIGHNSTVKVFKSKINKRIFGNIL